MKTGLTLQIALLAEQAKSGEIQVMTLAQAGRWFRDRHSLTPPTAVVCLNDWKHENRKTVWYDSRFYRLHILWENRTFFIRDLHRFDEDMVSPTHDTALATTFLVYGTLPVMDGALWSGSEKVGIWPVLFTPDGQPSPMNTDGPPVVQELTPTKLSIRQSLPGGGIFSMVCGETNVTFIVLDGQGQPLKWVLDMVGGAQQKAHLLTVSSNRVAYHSAGVNYHFRLAHDTSSCQQLTNDAIRLTPNSSGKLNLHSDGF